MADTTEVHRWRPVHGGDAWVRATDYDALAAKLAEVEEMKRLLAMDKINLRGELAGVQGKLAKADRLAEVLNDLLQNRGHCFIPNRIAGREDWDEDATEALKDFKGEKG